MNGLGDLSCELMARIMIDEMLNIIEGGEDALSMLFTWTGPQFGGFKATGLPGAADDLVKLASLSAEVGLTGLAGAMFVCDIWLRDVDKVRADGVMPRDAADAEEAVVAQWKLADGSTGCQVIRYGLDDHGHLVRRPTESEQIVGRILDALTQLVAS